MQCVSLFCTVWYLLHFTVFRKIHAHTKIVVESLFLIIEKRYIPFWKAKLHIFEMKKTKYEKSRQFYVQKVCKSGHFKNGRNFR